MTKLDELIERETARTALFPDEALTIRRACRAVALAVVEECTALVRCYLNDGWEEACDALKALEHDIRALVEQPGGEER